MKPLILCAALLAGCGQPGATDTPDTITMRPVTLTNTSTNTEADTDTSDLFGGPIGATMTLYYDDVRLSQWMSPGDVLDRLDTAVLCLSQYTSTPSPRVQFQLGEAAPGELETWRYPVNPDAVTASLSKSASDYVVTYNPVIGSTGQEHAPAYMLLLAYQHASGVTYDREWFRECAE